ncbi:MAG: NHLP-related RiPP peptide [Xanthomonadales bacterium]|nr:NHLP-related RiPP peptide [Xanthomonadales bacterium]
MTASRLPKEQELQLMKQLSTDDGFRARFEKSPTDSLKEIGVSDDQISKLDRVALQPGKLADKAAIADAHRKLSDANTSEHVCLIVPFMRIN